MNGRSKFGQAILLTAVFGAVGCAGTEAFVAAPSVSLASVRFSDIGFAQQTFLLGFVVENPNAFSLPVRKIRYRIMLEDRRFAGGETTCDITIPSNGDSQFVISVNLDLLQSGAQLTSIIRSGVQDDIGYELDGSLTVDIPLMPPISFSKTGTVAVQSKIF